MTENPYTNVMERARREASDKGHELGEWKQRDARKGNVAICDRCGGKITVSGEPNRILMGGSRSLYESWLLSRRRSGTDAGNR